MLGLIFTILFWVVYLGGVVFTAPIFAAEEAHRRGRIRVHSDDAIHGVFRSALWFVFGLSTYAQKQGDKRLAKMPDVTHRRVLAASTMSDEMDRALERNPND